MNIFKFLLVAFSLAQFNDSLAQYFEGKIIYEITYEAKSEDVNLKDLEKRQGNLVEYYIKNGHYKSVRLYNDTVISSNIYSHAENRIYSEYEKSRYIMWQDCSYTEDTLIEMSLSDDSISISGYSCQLLTKNTTGLNMTYVVTQQMKVDPATFAGHEMSFWYERLKMSNGGLAVQVINEHDDYISTWNLLKVEKEPLANEEWEINQDKIILPHPREHTSSPEIEGGLQSYYHCIMANIKYPKNARRKNIEGKVFVQFLVHEDGSISELEVVKGVNPEIDAEALKGFKQCGKKWIPAYIGNDPVKCPMILPINFKLR